MVTVLEASPHHQLADDVGHGVGEETCWVEGFAWRSEDHCLHTRLTIIIITIIRELDDGLMDGQQ